MLLICHFLTVVSVEDNYQYATNVKQVFVSKSLGKFAVLRDFKTFLSSSKYEVSA